jgi:SAM-dependent methyltransferase
VTVPAVLLKGDELFEEESSSSLYDRSREISKYLLMHYGDLADVFERPHHPLAAAHGYPRRLAEMLRSCAERTGTRVAKALDVGCNVGGVSHALSNWVEEFVLGVDISRRSVEIAQALSRNGGGTFSVAQQGPFTREVHVRLAGSRAKVEFAVGDACALPAGGFDAVLLSNVLDRVDDPVGCLEQFSGSPDILVPGGLLMVACPWSWYPEFSHPGTWLGSAKDNTPSEQALKEVLRAHFDLVLEGDEAGVLRQNPREYDYFEAHVTVWKRK